MFTVKDENKTQKSSDPPAGDIARSSPEFQRKRRGNCRQLDMVRKDF